MIKYKLTDQDMQTYNGFQWKMNEWKEVSGDIQRRLCSSAWLHCYDSPLLAILHNPIHARIANPRLFEVEVEGNYKNDKGLKCGYEKMRLIKEMPIPEVTTEQRIKYAILCAKVVSGDDGFNTWADNWLSGKDRTAHAAAYAAACATDAATHAAYAAIHTAASAATHAAYATDAATHAAYATIHTAANAAIYTAASATAHAAYAADIDLVSLAEQAVKE